MKNIIGLVGEIGSGKNTTANILVEDYDYNILNFGGILKDVVSIIFSWDRNLLEGDTKESREWRETVDTWWENRLNIPNLTPRWVLQHFATDTVRMHFHTDTWVAALEKKINDFIKNDQKVVITDVRFKNEIDLIHSINGEIVLVSKSYNLPIWYECAVQENINNLKEMKLKFPNVHISEYSWAGHKIDYTIRNVSDFIHLEMAVDNYLRTS
jgi:ABC-type dipeptide/oligopeptide/nickel transport system ATPase component